MKLAGCIKQQFYASIKLLVGSPQYNGRRDSRKWKQHKGGIAVLRRCSSKLGPFHHESLGITGIFPCHPVDRQNMRTPEKMMPSFQIIRLNQSGGQWDIPCAGQIPGDRESEKIAELAQQNSSIGCSAF